MFSVGDRVAQVVGKLKYSQYDGPSYGKVTDVLSDGRVVIKWDDKWKNDRSHPLNPISLFPEADIRFKFSILETEFKRVEDEVRIKMKEAGAIILDAAKFARDAGFEITNLDNAVGSLENAMGEAGWNTSSWHC